MDLLKKLRVKADQPLWLINAPDACYSFFSGLDIKEKLPAKKAVGQLLLFVYSAKELDHYLSVASPNISHDTLLWICYPKKSGAYTSDLIEMKSWDTVFNSGYRGQGSVSINDDWSGLRLTNAPRKEPSLADLPMEERKVEGIDFVKRTVQLPADAIAVVNKHKGLLAYFDSLAFTHKKEHVMAILDAKKEETRMRRIEKMVEMLQQKMTSKRK